MSGQTVGPEDLSHRELAILAAVAAGRAEIVPGSEPDLAIDGCWCDYVSAHRLAHAGLIRPTSPERTGQRVRAEVTGAGSGVLDALADRTVPLPLQARQAA